MKFLNKRPLLINTKLCNSVDPFLRNCVSICLILEQKLSKLTKVFQDYAIASANIQIKKC